VAAKTSLQKRECIRKNVGGTLSQRWDPNSKLPKPIAEIRGERSCPHQLVERTVGRHDDPRHRRNLPFSSYRHYGSFLERTQKGVLRATTPPLCLVGKQSAVVG
jgi:hypothetical protein